jgi:hypothetical protein
VLDELPEDEAAEVLDFIGYLRWRREEMDQAWFWTEAWRPATGRQKQTWQKDGIGISMMLKIYLLN